MANWDDDDEEEEKEPAPEYAQQFFFTGLDQFWSGGNKVIKPETPISKHANKAKTAISKVDTFLSAAQVATPEVAARLLDLCKRAHLQAAFHFEEAQKEMFSFPKGVGE